MIRRSTAAGIVLGMLLSTLQPASALEPAPVSGPIAAQASDEEQTAPPETTTVSVFGTGIVLSIGVDNAGHLTAVELTDDGGELLADAVVEKVLRHKIKFVIGENGTKVDVKTNGGKIDTKVKTRDLASLEGTHSWNGRLFGPDSDPTEISFHIGNVGTVPTIELRSLIGPGAGSEQLDTEPDTEDDEVESKLRIELTDADGNQARISIKVGVETDEADGLQAKLKITARSDFFKKNKAKNKKDKSKDEDEADDDPDAD